MFPVSQRFLTALRAPHTAVSRVTFRAADGATRNVPILAGAVSVDSGAFVRRSLSLSTPYSSWLVRELFLNGATLTAERGVRFPDGTTEWARLGTFVATRHGVDVAASSTLDVDAADTFVRVVRSRFVTPVITRGGAASEALRLASEATGTGSSNLATSNPYSKGAVWERDRAEAVQKLARAAPCEVFANVYGVATARDVPDPLRDPPVWVIDASSTGVLISGKDDATTERAYNTVVVSPRQTDGTPIFAPVVVSDTNPASPTYVGAGANRRLVPYFVTNELINTASQARAVGLATLRRVSAPVTDTAVDAIVNPALDAGDVVSVRLPDGTVRSLVVKSFSVPFAPDASMSVDMASSRADDPEGE